MASARSSGAQDSPAGLFELCPILTTKPNAVLQPKHDGIPIILPPTAYGVWLDPAVCDVEPVQALLTSYPADEMIAYPVSPRLNNPANESPACIASLA
jgi:putative SOS response-associated peptidase YedK